MLQIFRCLWLREQNLVDDDTSRDIPFWSLEGSIRSILYAKLAKANLLINPRPKYQVIQGLLGVRGPLFSKKYHRGRVLLMFLSARLPMIADMWFRFISICRSKFASFYTSHSNVFSSVLSRISQAVHRTNLALTTPEHSSKLSEANRSTPELARGLVKRPC